MGPQRRDSIVRRVLLAFIFLAFAVALPSPTWPQSTDSFLISKSPRIDLRALTDKASSGDPGAQYELGIRYQSGLGVDKSEYEAMRWYQRAANSGNPDAQNNLAYLYETGPDGLRDMTEAVKWYKRAAIYGDAAAQLNV